MRFTAVLHQRGFLLGLAVLLTLAALTLLAVRTRKNSEKIAQPVVMWVFEQGERGAIISTPFVTPECVFVAAIRDNALAPSGVVYCLDRQNGRVRWQFDEDGAMLHTVSSPCVQDGRLYVGEGMHGNDVCKLYCLEAATGRKLWHFVTGGHIESSPCVADGMVVFGSGDDGVYALDAATGSRLWQFADCCHVDVTPAIVEGRVYAGSGVSERYRKSEILCLKLTDGQPLWRKTTELPVWGSPLVDGEQVFFGAGTGRLTKSAEPPERTAGALVCADAATGNIEWTYHTDDALFARCSVDPRCVYFGARDGRCYCLDRRDGRRLWEFNLGQPIVTQPALHDGKLYVIASGGRFCCLDKQSGQAVWTFDVAQHTQTRPQLLSSPLVLNEGVGNDAHHLIFFGTELRNAIKSSAVLYCLREDARRGDRQ